MSETAPLLLSCRFCRPLVEGCPSVFEILLSSTAPEPVKDILIEFRCAGLKGGVAEFALPRPLVAGEVLQLDVDIEPERKGTPSMNVHIHAGTSRGRFSARGSVRPGGQSGVIILERPADMQSLTVQIQEKAFFGTLIAEGGLDIGKVKTLNDFLQLHLPVMMEPVPLSWDGFPVARSLKPGGLFAGRFKLIEPLGQGGMGVVWLAEDLNLRLRRVALKFLPESVCHDPDAIDDLKHELLLSQQLTHENIVRIHDLIEAEGTAAISMEFIDGSTLSGLRRQQENRVLSPMTLRPLLQQICDALAYAHGKGIIHHDLKPLNFMLSADGVLKVCDFGLAGSLAESRSHHSRPGHTSGTTPYMSPQHLLLGSRTIADDIYGIGATLYELLTSKPPFYTGSIEMQIESHLPPSMKERREMLRIKDGDSIPPEWEELVRSCLSKLPEDRPSSTAHLWQKLVDAEKAAAHKAHEERKAQEARESAAAEADQKREAERKAMQEKAIEEAAAARRRAALDEKRRQEEREAAGERKRAAESLRQQESRTQEKEEGTAPKVSAKDRVSPGSPPLPPNLKKKLGLLFTLIALLAFLVVLLQPDTSATDREKDFDNKPQQEISPVQETDAPQSEFAKSDITDKRLEVSLPGNVKLFLCHCPSGSILIGSRDDEPRRRGEGPQEYVTFKRGFWMAKTELTQAQWISLRGDNPSYFKGSELPVEMVSKNDADAFIALLNRRVPMKGWEWVLPSESMWEYSCRAGTLSAFNLGSDLGGKDANIDGNYPFGIAEKGAYLQKTTPVASYSPNAWGLHDMHGNVREWCADKWNGISPLQGGIDPVGRDGDFCVNRGGAWNSGASDCRSASRNFNAPDSQLYTLGFRPALVPSDK